MKWSEGLSNKMSIIIRRHKDHINFAAYMTVTIIIFLHIPLVILCIIVRIYTWLYVMYVSV